MRHDDTPRSERPTKIVISLMAAAALLAILALPAHAGSEGAPADRSARELLEHQAFPRDTSPDPAVPTDLPETIHDLTTTDRNGGYPSSGYVRPPFDGGWGWGYGCSSEDPDPQTGYMLASTPNNQDCVNYDLIYSEVFSSGSGGGDVVAVESGTTYTMNFEFHIHDIHVNGCSGTFARVIGGVWDAEAGRYVAFDTGPTYTSYTDRSDEWMYRKVSWTVEEDRTYYADFIAYVESDNCGQWHNHARVEGHASSAAYWSGGSCEEDRAPCEGLAGDAMRTLQEQLRGLHG